MEFEAARERWCRWPRKRARSGDSGGSESCSNPSYRGMAGLFQLPSSQEGQANTSTGKQRQQLLLPNFVADANKLVDILDAKEEGNLDGETTSIREREHLVQELIDARINSLSGLFRPRHRQSSTKTRASDMTDRQLSDWVLKGACSETFLCKRKEQQLDRGESDDIPTKHESSNDVLMKQIGQKYQSRREELRGMAKSANSGGRRRVLAADGGTNAANAAQVRMDRHGRLIRIGDETRGEGADDARRDEVELEDASEAFWRQLSTAEGQDLQGNEVRGRRPGMVDPSSTAEPPVSNQPMRLRDISRQMDRDATSAIQRALDRYRLEEEESNGREALDVELVHIPLRDPADENDVPRLSLFRRNRDRHQNDNQGERALGQERHPQGERENGGVGMGGNVLDLRLTVRRIFFAVITVAAAFVCIMIQGLPLDFGDEISLELDEQWLSGLMGPHFQGHHSSFRVAGNGDVVPEEDEDPSPFAMFLPKRPAGGPPGVDPPSTSNFVDVPGDRLLQLKEEEYSRYHAEKESSE